MLFLSSLPCPSSCLCAGVSGYGGHVARGFSTHWRFNWADYSPQAKICGCGPMDEEWESALDVTQKWPKSKRGKHKRPAPALIPPRWRHRTGCTVLDSVTVSTAVLAAELGRWIFTMPSPPAVRVIVRLPYNRPEDAPTDPPRVRFIQPDPEMCMCHADLTHYFPFSSQV